MMENKLLASCPFGGSTDLQIDEMVNFLENDDTVYYRVLCLNCCAEMPADTEKEAVKWWNTRCTTTPEALSLDND